MIAKERIEEANRNVRQYIADGLLRVKDDTAKRFVRFFMDNSESSLETAVLLYKISDDETIKNTLNHTIRCSMLQLLCWQVRVSKQEAR